MLQMLLPAIREMHVLADTVVWARRVGIVRSDCNASDSPCGVMSGAGEAGTRIANVADVACAHGWSKGLHVLPSLVPLPRRPRAQATSATSEGSAKPALVSGR